MGRGVNWQEWDSQQYRRTGRPFNSQSQMPAAWYSCPPTPLVLPHSNFCPTTGKHSRQLPRNRGYVIRLAP